MFGRKKPERALDSELRFHLEQQVQNYVSSGMTTEEARRRARLEFGGLDQIKESCRDVRTGRYLAELVQDLRFGWRMLWKARRTTAISIGVIAIGVGANMAAFSIADAFLLRPLRVPGIERLTRILAKEQGPIEALEVFSAPEFLELQTGSRSFESIAAWYEFTGNVSGGQVPEVSSGMVVSANFFRVFGVAPVLGRGLVDDDGLESSEPAAVISYGLWGRQFAFARDTIGKTIRVRDRNYSVAGVMPKEFRYLPEADVWVPLILTPKDRVERTKVYLALVARLRDGVTPRQASAELTSLSLASPDTRRQRAARAAPLSEHLVSGDDGHQYIYLLWTSAFLVLLVATANVANLQYARASLRTREIAIRTALGAGRLRLLRQLVTENALLGILACIAGACAAIATVSFLRAGFSPKLARYLSGWDYFSVNPRALAYGLGAAVLAGLLAGIAPALFASGVRPAEQLKAGDCGASSGRTRHRLKNALVVIQVSLSMVLLVGAANLTASIRSMSEPLPGTDPDSALTLRMNLSESEYPGPLQIRAFQHRLLDALHGIPGVKSAAVVMSLPYEGTRDVGSFLIEGQPVFKGVRLPTLVRQPASPEYFQAMHIPIVKGRAFEASDSSEAAPVAVVSEALAREQFPGKDPLGRRLKLFSAKSDQPGSNQPWITIVGVAKDVPDLPGEAPMPTVYHPYEQIPSRYFDVILRPSSPPLEISRTVLAKLHEIDPGQPAYDVRTLSGVYDDQVGPLKWVAGMVGVLGMLALILAAMGVFSVVASAALERRKEVAIRMAFGAPAQAVTWMVLKQSLALTMAGAAIGVIASAALSRILTASIPEVHAASLSLYAGVAVFLAVIALPACYFPARRAALADPAETLRSE
jgi:putative ABC transport system permease protein